MKDGGKLAGLRDYLATRRSVPANRLVGEGPDEAALQAMLVAASRVPDHGKLARWRFVIFRGEARQRAGEAFVRIARQNGTLTEDPAREAQERERFLRAPLVVAVVSTAAPHPKIPEWEQVLSAGAVCLNLIHAAAAHGFSAQWLTEWMAYDGQARAAIGLTAEERIAGFVHIGTADFAPPERDRPDLQAIVTHFVAAGEAGTVAAGEAGIVAGAARDEGDASAVPAAGELVRPN